MRGPRGGGEPGNLTTLLVGLSATRWVQGRPDLALENTLVNLGVNAYPILHHRHTRLRILHILEKGARRGRHAGAISSG